MGRLGLRCCCHGARGYWMASSSARKVTTAYGLRALASRRTLLSCGVQGANLRRPPWSLRDGGSIATAVSPHRRAHPTPVAVYTAPRYPWEQPPLGDRGHVAPRPWALASLPACSSPHHDVI